MSVKPNPAQHRRNVNQRSQPSNFTYSKFVGRVGALAVALGVGAGFTLGIPSLARADDTESSSSPDPSPNQSAKQPDRKQKVDSSNDAESEPKSAAEKETAPEPKPAEQEATPEAEQNSEGPIDESHRPGTATAEPTTSSKPATVESPIAPEPTATPPSPPVNADLPAAPTEPAEAEPAAETPLEQPASAPRGVAPPALQPARPAPGDPIGGSDPVDNPVRMSGTVIEVAVKGPVDTSVLTPAGLETVTLPKTALLSDPHTTKNFGAAHSISSAVAVSPAPALPATPSAATNIVTGFLAAVLSPLVAPGPAAPTQPPLVFFAVFDWVRREIQRTFFNRTPQAVVNAYTTSEGVEVSDNVLTDDSDADGDTLRASLVDGPDHGDLTLNPDGTFVYTPAENYAGTDTFTYKVSDEGFHLHDLFGFLRPDHGHSDTATVSITITPANPNPVVAEDDTAVTNEDNLVTFDVLGNDTGGDGGPLTIVLDPYPQATNGSVAFNGFDSSLTYTPNFNFFGTDTFTYTVSDGTTSDTATVTVTVKPVNDIAVTMGDNYNVTENGTLTVDGPGVLANDTDIDGDPLTAVKFSDPTNGAVMLNADGSFTYTPDADFTGLDSFQYYAYDGTTPGSLAFVNIEVTKDVPNATPVANYDSFATAVDTAVTFDKQDLLDNDFDAEGDALTVVVTAVPGNGELVVNGDGTYTYTPDDGFIGTDEFQYVVADATGESDPAVVSINVGIPANAVPVAVPDHVATRVDTPRVITPIELVGNDTDADGEALTPYVVSDPAHGTLVFDVGGTYTYTPDPGFTGYDSFYYTAFDGYADSAPTRVDVLVAGQSTGNTPPVAGYDSLATEIDTPLPIGPETLLANDFDADGDPLSVVVTQYPVNGVLSTDDMGNLVYTPDDGFTGIDSFFYSAGRPENASLPAEVTINVGGPANTAPEASPDELFTGLDTPLIFAAEDLLANDTDVDGDDLDLYIVSVPAHGILSDNGDGSFTYAPDPGFVGTVGFSYTAFDGQADSIPTLVTINVGGAEPNTPPIAYDDFLSTPVDTPLALTAADLLGNDVDPDGDSSQLGGFIVSFPTHGTLINETGIYTPDTGFEGIDSFTYQANDGQDDSNVATVYITVGQLSEGPSAFAQVSAAAPQTQQSGRARPAGDTTAPMVTLTAPANGATVSGTVALKATASDNVKVTGVQFLADGEALGAAVKTPDATGLYGVSWNTTTAGTHTLTARASDAAGNTATSTVTVTVPDTTAPAVSVTGPATGATVSGTVPVGATASDNVGVAGVQFKLDGALLGAEDPSSPYGVSWNTTTVQNGTHTLTAEARDAAGNKTTSTAVSVTVNNPDITAPTVSLIGPATGATVKGRVTVGATASDNVGVAGVQFLLDNGAETKALGAEDTTAPYVVSWDTATVSDGTYTLTAEARDAAGNTTTSTARTVTVANASNHPPELQGEPTVGAADLDTGRVSGSFTIIDEDADILSYSETGPFNGDLALYHQWDSPTDPTHTFNYTYTPTQAARDQAAQTSGPDTDGFSVEIGDGAARTWVNVTVPIEPRPSGIPIWQGPTTDTFDPVTGTSTGKINAIDPNNDPLGYSVVYGPWYGTLDLDTETGDYTYTPTGTGDLNQGELITIGVSDGQYTIYRDWWVWTFVTFAPM